MQRQLPNLPIISALPSLPAPARRSPDEGLLEILGLADLLGLGPEYHHSSKSSAENKHGQHMHEHKHMHEHEHEHDRRMVSPLRILCSVILLQLESPILTFSSPHAIPMLVTGRSSLPQSPAPRSEWESSELQ